MRIRHIGTVGTLVFALLLFGLPSNPPEVAHASIITTPVAWSASGGGFESQEIRHNANMIGLTWSEDRPMSAWYRVKRNGRWTQWISLQVEGDHGPDRNTAEHRRTKHGSDPVWVDNSEAVQFRTTGGGSRATEAVLIDTARPAKPAIHRLSDFLMPQVPAASGATSRPLIRPRSDWDPSNTCQPKSAPDQIQVTHAFVHHTSTSESANNYSIGDVPSRILGICLFHTKSRGWDDIGYNFLIDRYGQIWEGRAGGIELGIRGAHTAGFNGYSLGVAFIGYHTNRGPTAAAEAALHDLLAWKAELHNMDMSATTTLISRGSEKWEKGTPVPMKAISGHRDAQSTSCPGEACYRRLPTYRSVVNQRWSQIPLSTYRSPLLGDFDGDGSEEAAVFRTTDGHWLVVQPGGSTSTWADFSTARGWGSQLVGDFNGDGRDDIANFHPSNGTWWVSRSTGSGFATSLWADFSTATGWTSQIVGDFNGDGRDDIANFHPSNGTWWVSRSTGSGFATSLWADFTTASGWTIQLIGDFNGDGKDDVASRHVGNGTWWVVRSNGGSFSSPTNWGTTSTLDHLSHSWTQDVDRDGLDDILTLDAYHGFVWRHESSGKGFDIDWVMDTPWRTTVGGAGQRVEGADSWLFFGQEFQWVQLSDLDVFIPNTIPDGSERPMASASIAATLPRP